MSTDDTAQHPATQRLDPDGSQVHELRLVMTVQDFDAAVALYRDTLGLPQAADFSGEQGRVVLLEAGRATIELVDADQAAYIDDVEVGRRVAGTLRVALGVHDAARATGDLTAGGATVVAEPTRTPWDSLNARLDTPDGVHVTVFVDAPADAR
ncbi:VOC family protein [Actinotalea ferrariae]|uniref:VOC family protein n=1 Tax=Actinotalea ferrariae TaxID=1386098 RepID=UPI001C8C9031|nr:VOC family protein [Actinotalea ferrariae]MBX9244849.1 VOC family protein [Actinotalea ferrariae]